jgi:hypothetical protein
VAGRSLHSIAASLSRAPSSVSREINRNGGRQDYRANVADEAFDHHTRIYDALVQISNSSPPDCNEDLTAVLEIAIFHWHTFDPRNNAPRIGRILLARGRDAADIAMTTTFGPNNLQSFRVWADEIAGSA